MSEVKRPLSQLSKHVVLSLIDNYSHVMEEEEKKQ